MSIGNYFGSDDAFKLGLWPPCGALMHSCSMRWANENNAKVQLNTLTIESEIDEQRGYKSIFARSVCGYSQSRGHEVDVGDTPDEALDYLVSRD
jgi:hypothetical protein